MKNKKGDIEVSVEMSDSAKETHAQRRYKTSDEWRHDLIQYLWDRGMRKPDIMHIMNASQEELESNLEVIDGTDDEYLSEYARGVDDAKETPAQNKTYPCAYCGGEVEYKGTGWTHIKPTKNKWGGICTSPTVSRENLARYMKFISRRPMSEIKKVTGLTSKEINALKSDEPQRLKSETARKVEEFVGDENCPVCRGDSIDNTHPI